MIEQVDKICDDLCLTDELGHIVDHTEHRMQEAARHLGLSAIGNDSAPIQLAQCRFPGLAISNVKILIYFQIKYTKALLSNSTRKLLWFEITKMPIAV